MLWDGFEVFSLAGTLLLLAGLARAGVMAWWALAVLVAGVAGLMLIPWDLPHLSALAVLIGFSPFAMVGARLVQRVRLTRP
jgi:membrane protein implicated in regulation of membrane protease activity